MTLQSIARFAVFTATLAPYAGVFAQGASVSDIVNGKFPKKISAKELPDTFHPARIVSSGPVPDPLASLLPMMMLGGSGATGTNMELLSYADESWTDGSIAMVEGQRFLVTYRLDGSMADVLGTMRGQTPANLAVKGDLRLLLIRVDGIQSISPDPELTKEKLVSLLKPVEEIGADTAAPATPTDLARAKTATLSNLKQVALGTVMYCSDWDDIYPWAQSTKAVQFVTLPYLKDAKLWRTYNPNGGEIRFNMALGGVSDVSLPNPSETVMFFESKEWPDGSRIVAYADGHVKVASRAQWSGISKSLMQKFPRTAKRPLPLNYGIDEIK